MASNFLDELKDLILLDNPETAIDRLIDFLKARDEKTDTVYLVSARYHRLKKEMIEGVVPRDDAQVERNRINSALLAAIDDIAKRIGE